MFVYCKVSDIYQKRIIITDEKLAIFCIHLRIHVIYLTGEKYVEFGFLALFVFISLYVYFMTQERFSTFNNNFQFVTFIRNGIIITDEKLGHFSKMKRIRHNSSGEMAVLRTQESRKSYH